mgnify:CR=1 FL=1
MQTNKNNQPKTLISIGLWIILVIIAFAIEESIKDFEWFKNLTGMIKTILQNFALFVFFITTIILVYLLIKWKIQNNYMSIKTKIIAQKKFNDFFFVDMSNHINKEIKKLELRCIELEKKAEIYKDPVITENDKIAQENDKRLKTEKITEYNDAFKDWEIDNFGKGINQTKYKSYSEFHNVK